jgi:transcription elongation factor Elf1
MSNYPPGSMMGSGIFSVEVPVEFTCTACGKDNDTEGDTNDWGTEVYVMCTHCREEHTFDIEEDEEHV